MVKDKGMMKIACISASTVPSGTANSIQAMKVCQSLAQIGDEVRLWLPGDRAAGWDALAEQYGLETPFEITWLPANPRLKRYDFAWQALRAARAWGAGAVYTWVPQAALLALWSSLPMLMELHDRPTGQVGPWMFRQIVRHPGKKRLLFITQALQHVLEREQGVRVHPGEACIAPDGVDLERYQNLPARRRSPPPVGFERGSDRRLHRAPLPWARHGCAGGAGPGLPAGQLSLGGRAAQRCDPVAHAHRSRWDWTT